VTLKRKLREAWAASKWGAALAAALVVDRFEVVLVAAALFFFVVKPMRAALHALRAVAATPAASDTTKHASAT
jgi:hypothetical protein